MKQPASPIRRNGPIAWFAANPVAANLLMMLIVCGGVSSLLFMEKEVFPPFKLPRILISATYPGAGPLEIEESVCIRIEEAIYDLPGIEQLKSDIYSGRCDVRATVLPRHDKDRVQNAISARIEAIQRLPKSLEKIDVKTDYRQGDDGVIWVALHGNTDSLTLKRFGERIQGDLARLKGVNRARNYYEVPYEIAIEVSSDKLRRHKLSVQQIAEAVRRASVDLPGGLVKTRDGELLLRVKGRAPDGDSFGNIVVQTSSDGSRVFLRDIAKIKDGMEERMSEWHHNGETAQGWEIHADSDTVAVARRVKAYIEEMNRRLPEGLAMYAWWDDSQAYDERITTLLEDGCYGFVLVCLVLTLFLRLNVALWAGSGMLVSVFGALWLMPVFGVSLNMLSLFGFLLAMGILVDDAIVVGESVYRKQSSDNKLIDAGGVREREINLNNAIQGARAVALPVVLAVLTTTAAFFPGLFLPGWAGQMVRPISLVMILTLMFSIIEALLILPAHLAGAKSMPNSSSPLKCLREQLNAKLDAFVANCYRPLLYKALAWRYFTLSLFAVTILLSVALVSSGNLRLSLHADVVKDSFWAKLKLPQDMPYSETRRIAERVEQALLQLRRDTDRDVIGLEKMATTVTEASVLVGLESLIWEHGAGFWTELSPAGRERVVVEDFVREWRKRIGDIGRAQIDFIYKEGDSVYDLELNMAATDPELLAPAAERLKTALAAYPGVYDVVDSAEAGKPEIRLRLKPAAERLGLRLQDLAEQARGAYYGEEVQRLQRGREEVKVMIRLPYRERRSLDDLKRLPVSLPDGGFAPLASLAEIDLEPGYASLVRLNRQRILKIQARVDPGVGDVNGIYADLDNGEIPRLQRQFPGLEIVPGEERREQEATLETLGGNTVIALLAIYALIAVPFRSYAKPLIFLLAIPVAWSGAVFSHWLAGLPLSMESLVGMVAAAGVVVNDSLVLANDIKGRNRTGRPLTEVIAETCSVRFRPILLAFLTTFVGVLPLLLETSAQARFLVPMALSLSSGLLFGLSASLILTPVCFTLFYRSSEPTGFE